MPAPYGHITLHLDRQCIYSNPAHQLSVASRVLAGVAYLDVSTPGWWCRLPDRPDFKHVAVLIAAAVVKNEDEIDAGLLGVELIAPPHSLEGRHERARLDGAWWGEVIKRRRDEETCHGR